MKRILKGLLAAGLAVSLVVPGTLAFAAVEEEQIPRYSYKIDGHKDEFGNTYGYSSGGTKPYTSQVSGKHGNAMQAHIFGSKGLGWGQIVFEFARIPLTVGLERIHFDDYIQEVQSLSFWAKTPKMQYNAPDVNVRKLPFSIGVQYTDGTSQSFSKTIEYPNTDQWQYIMLPFDEMVGGDTTLKDALASGKVASFTRFNLDFGNGTNFFGATPTGEPEEWHEYITIDEMLFDRSTPENPAIIPPSSGEEEYLANANIKNVLVDGVTVADFDPEAKENNIAVPGYYTAEDILEHVSVEVEAPPVEASSTQQPISGATYKIDPPESVPGEGTIYVYSGNFLGQKPYHVNFVAREGLQVDAAAITGIDFTQNTVPGGEKAVNVPMVNEGKSASAGATVIGVIRDTETGEVYSVDTAETGAIAAGETGSAALNLSVPGNGDYCMASLYFVDDLDQMGTVYTTISTGDDAGAVTKDSKAKLTEKNAVMDMENGTLTISGTVTGAKSGETVNIAVYQPGAGKGAENLQNFAAAKIVDGMFSYDYTLVSDTMGEAKIDLAVGGKTEEISVYVADEAAVKAAMTAYQALTADAEDAVLAEFINTHGAALGCAMDMVQALDAPAQAAAVRAAAGKGYAYDALVKALNTEISFAYIKSQPTAAEMTAMFKKYTAAFGFDTDCDCYQNYIKEDAQLNAIFTAMLAETYQDMDEAAEGFERYTALAAIDSANADGIVEILSDHKTAIGSNFNYTKYNTLTANQKRSFAIKLISKTIKSFAELNTALTDYIDSLNKGNGTSGPSTPNRPSSSNPIITVDKSDQPKPTATPQPPVNDSRFSDMESAQWAVEAVDTLYDLGIVNGDGTGRFNPEGSVTREEFAKMIVGVFGLPMEEAVSSFRDVEPNAWYMPYVAVAAKNGIVRGDEEGNFGVGQNITRQDMAVMILRALTTIDKAPDTAVNAEFADDMEIADYAKAAVYGMSNAGIVNGVGDGRFAPTENATRAEAAKMLYGVYQYAALGK